MSQPPVSSQSPIPQNVLANLTPVVINGQTVYIAQVSNDSFQHPNSTVVMTSVMGQSPGELVMNVNTNPTSTAGVQYVPPGMMQVRDPGVLNDNNGVTQAGQRSGKVAPENMPSKLFKKDASLTYSSDEPRNISSYVHKVSKGDGMRKLLLPWLVEHLDKYTFEGVRWIDRNEGLFMLPWKHGKKRGYEEDVDGEVFKEWAVNTGRYRPDEPTQYKVWKATLRNALHKHPHIREIKDIGKSGFYRAWKILVSLSSVFEKVINPHSVVDNLNKSRSISESYIMESEGSYKLARIMEIHSKPTLLGPPMSHSSDPKTPTNSQLSPPMSTIGSPTTPATPTLSDYQKGKSPQDNKTSELVYTPLSILSPGMSIDTEYNNELEMSPASSVVTTVDVVNNYSASSAHHIRSASGTVLSDIDELLKQVSSTNVDADKNSEMRSEENGFDSFSDILMNGEFLGSPPQTMDRQPVQQQPAQQQPVQQQPAQQQPVHQQSIQQQPVQQQPAQQQSIQQQPVQQQPVQQYQQNSYVDEQSNPTLSKQQKKGQKSPAVPKQIRQQSIQHHQQLIQQQNIHQQNFQQQNAQQQNLQQQKLQHPNLQQQQHQQQQQQHNQQQYQQHQQSVNHFPQQQPLSAAQQKLHHPIPYHQNLPQQSPPLSLQQQFLMQERRKQQQYRSEKQNSQENFQQSITVPQPNLNQEQNQKLAELKKQRETLKKPFSKEVTSASQQQNVYDLPIQDFLGVGPEPRRLGKRPRLESIVDLSTEGLNSVVDYLAKLNEIGLPKKQSPNSMAITIYYKTVGVAAYGISNPVGARLYYCSTQRVQVTDEKTTNELYGPPDATQICMPWCRDNTPTQTLLGTLTRGVILQENKGDIYATRLCQCAVFFGDKRGVLTKLERGQKVKIFDFKTRFLSLYFQHLQCQHSGSKQSETVLDPFPDPDVMLSFGQIWDDRRPIENTLIWAKVIHMQSRQLTLDFTQLFPPPPPIANEDCIQFSESDPYDRLADAFSLAL